MQLGREYKGLISTFHMTMVLMSDLSMMDDMGVSRCFSSLEGHVHVVASCRFQIALKTFDWV